MGGGTCDEIIFISRVILAIYVALQMGQTALMVARQYYGNTKIVDILSKAADAKAVVAKA